jgi:hypothetical protein
MEYDVNRSKRSVDPRKKASGGSVGSLYVVFLRMVAGVRFELTTFGL